jgi:hypothetical protein
VLRDVSRNEIYIVTGRSVAGGAAGDGCGGMGYRTHRGIHMAPPGLRPAQRRPATARMLGIAVHIDDDPRTAYHLALW